MGQLILAEMLFEFPIFGPAAPPFHGAHEGNKGHGIIWALEADFYDTPRWVMHDGTTLTCSVRQ